MYVTNDKPMVPGQAISTPAGVAILRRLFENGQAEVELPDGRHEFYPEADCAPCYAPEVAA